MESTGDISKKLKEMFEGRVAVAIKQLLEGKHLYQHVDVEEPQQAIDELCKGRTDVEKVLFYYWRTIGGFWELMDEDQRSAYAAGDQFPPTVNVRPYDIKVYCDKCERKEAFNLTRAQNSFFVVTSPPGPAFQVFTLTCLCQSCKDVSEVFLVRREDLKLTLCGRAPIEHVDVPSFIPKGMKAFYSGAVVAHQSGHTLAGLFYLRVLIEQWARLFAKSNLDNADQVLDQYMKTLPDDFKKHFPSLKKLYDDISKDIHQAVGSPELFDNTLEQIEEHFDARRVHKLAPPP